jgi:integrase
MYLNHGSYYFHPKGAKPVNLGRDLPDALTKYGQLIGSQWSGRTLGDVIDRYRIEVLPLKRSEHTRKNEGAQLDRLKRVFGDLLPDSITTQHCYQYADKRRDKTGKPVPSAARHEIALLGHVFAKAIRWGVATHNPVRAMEKEIKRHDKRYVTDDEYAAVYSCATERMQVAMDLALLTGLRRTDLLSLRRANLTDEGIVIQTSKTGAGLLIEYTPDLSAVIDRAKKLKPQVGPGNYLLRTRAGTGYSALGFSANWRRTVAKAVEKHGIRGFTFHDLRRKSASDSASVKEAQERLGHASEAVTRRFYMARPVRVRPLR